MQQEHGAGVGFSVHPRPEASGASFPAVLARRATRFAAGPRDTAAEDVTRHRDTAVGDLAFLVRFAFGGY